MNDLKSIKEDERNKITTIKNENVEIITLNGINIKGGAIYFDNKLNIKKPIEGKSDLIINGKTYLNDVSISGNLYIEGNTVYSNVEELRIEDKLITLNGNSTLSAIGSGINPYSVLQPPGGFL